MCSFFRRKPAFFHVLEQSFEFARQTVIATRSNYILFSSNSIYKSFVNLTCGNSTDLSNRPNSSDKISKLPDSDIKRHEGSTDFRPSAKSSFLNEYVYFDVQSREVLFCYALSDFVCGFCSLL